MSDKVADAQERILQVVKVLKASQTLLDGIHTGLPVSAREERMLEGDEDPDEPTEMRSVIECVLADCLGPAIRDLTSAARYRRAGKLASLR